MDTDKLKSNLAALDSALSALDKAVELRAQTGMFRNQLSATDLDKVAALCVVSIKEITKELEGMFK